MPLINAKTKKEAQEKLKSALMAEFAEEVKSNPAAAKSHERTAKAISVLVDVIFDAIKKEAEVAPGIKVDTSGGPGATTAPGKIS